VAIEILNSSDSVTLAKKAATESGVLKQLLVQLQGETSFSMPDAPLTTVEASQEHGLQQGEREDAALAMACALVDELELGWETEWQTAAITDWEASGL
jgi:antitoxin ParD1/3/4